jgi:hypothetical protein
MAIGARASVGMGLVGLTIAAAMTGLPASASSGCTPISTGEPCLAPIQSVYAFDGMGSGAVTYMKAHAGPEKIIEKTIRHNEAVEVIQRTFTWHSVPSVKIVAVFIEIGTRGSRKPPIYKRVPTGSHSGHAVLTFGGGHGANLLLEGLANAHGSTHIHPTSAVARAASHCYIAEVPCLGRLEALYPFSGRDGGAIRSYHVTLGPEEEAGKDTEGPIVRRSFAWRSIPSVKLVAAFILTVRVEHNKAVMEDGRYKWRWRRVPTGAHSGKAMLTTDQADRTGLQPDLLLEGKQT